MTSPLDSSDKDQIQQVDQELAQFIQQAQSGNENMSDLLNIQQQLSRLAQNPQIPSSVQLNLQTALNQLKQVQSGTENLSNLFTAKMQVDEALGVNPQGSEPEEGEEGEEGSDKGSLE